MNGLMRSLYRFIAGYILLGLWLGPVLGKDLSKSIRLRNGTIETPLKGMRAAAPAVADEVAASGLYLVQFEGKPQPAWKAELSAKGVELLHFVPEDTFVARLEGVKLGELRGLEYVRWVGLLEPRYKIHSTVVKALAADPGEPVAVRVLLRDGSGGLAEALATTRLEGAQIQTTRALGPIASGRVRARGLLELVRSGEVIWIEAAPKMKLFDEVSTKIVAGETGEVGGLAWVHQLGFDGRGVTVAVADSGLDIGFIDLMHPDIDGRVDALFAYGGLDDASDEHSHGTHCAGIIAGNAALGQVDDDGALWGLGVAPGSHLVGQRIFDGLGNYRSPPSFEVLTRDAVRAGAYVGSNSWGEDTQGRYDLTAAEFDALVRDADSLTPGDQEYVLEFSAGNSGPGGQTIGTPAVAKNVIATGACQNNRYVFGIYGEGQEVMADFSSRGPAEDGRIKPDIVAPGTWIASLKSQASGDENAWSPINDNYLYQGGTSQSGPHVSGACAVFIQWHRETRGGITPSPALVKAALINSADDMGTALVPTDPDDPDDPGEVVGDTGPVPNNDEGWGRLNLENLIDSERRHDFTDQGVELTTGGVWEKRVVVSAGEPLKVTLVYTDVPGLPAAIPALVNDLDLEVISPSGILHRGNAFAEGETVAGTPVGDRINNVEGVLLTGPESGEWIVRVRAVNVVQDIRRRTGDPRQDFALVVSGQLPAPGEGVISWDRAAYRVPGVALLRLLDDGLRGEPAVTVRLESSSTAGFLNLNLTRATSANTFTGAVSLVTGPAGPGQWQASDGEILRAVYVDADPAGERLAEARIDMQPPVISDIAATAQFGQVALSWLSSEPASSRILYGTTNAVTNLVEDIAFRLQPRVALPVLEAGTTYFYTVVATDRAGNSVTNDNGGRFHRFVAPRPSAALLVYSPEQIFVELLPESPYPGMESWTSALDSLGIDYEVWNTQERGGAPTAEQLKAYRVVLWRPEELQAPTPGMTTALTTYMAGGGSLFVASFDLMTRLTELNQVAFARDVLRVASFEEDRGAVYVESTPGDPVGSGATIDLDYSEFPSGFLIDLLGIVWETGPDHLQLAVDAAPVFLQEDGRIVGLRFPRTGQDSRGRGVFLTFPLEAVPLGAPAPNNRATVLGNALEFLVPGLQGLTSVALSSPAYTVPGSGLVEVFDSRLAGSTNVVVTLATTSVPDAVEVQCFETPLRGVFRGRFVLVPPTGAGPAADPPPLPGAPVRIAARNGDGLVVRYVDSGGRELGTTAIVDTTAPVISGVEVETSYSEATIVWTTDKPTDALVRFGETGGDEPFLTRSGYSDELGLSHEVQLRGLLPDRTYYFVVVSRDQAGNTTTDNRGGELYTLRTLRPVIPPWFDDLESGRVGWAVFNNDSDLGGGFDDDDGGGGGFLLSGWQYGVPENRLGIQARSGTNCWATNLRGEFVDLAITDLISPAISLVGGNRARLKFWQYYDFTASDEGGEDDFGDFTIEIAQVAVSLDGGNSWRALYSNPEEQSDGWEEVSLDLSPFLGNVVRFRFNYQMFSFNGSERPGWFIDDVSVEMQSVAETGLVVSNSLAQARFTVVSGTNQWTGQGTVWRTNLNAGSYDISWNPVPWHVTPQPQTFVIGSSTNLTAVTGRYGVVDSNTNGIPDPWERHFFDGALLSPETRDADGDGADELREFMSGTDPRDADSVFTVELPVELPNRTVRVGWLALPEREYVLEVSTDLVTWTGLSESIRGTGERVEMTLPALDPRLAYLFRVRVWP
jgi:hypothetical protein